MEAPVNQNPWFIEQTAKYERQQIQADMRQIHLGERAMRADQLAVRHAKVQESKSSSPVLRRVALTLGKAILAMIG